MEWCGRIKTLINQKVSQYVNEISGKYLYIYILIYTNICFSKILKIADKGKITLKLYLYVYRYE